VVNRYYKTNALSNNSQIKRKKLGNKFFVGSIGVVNFRVQDKKLGSNKNAKAQQNLAIK
jgi:hypothetical protein